MSFLNYVTATLRALFAWRGLYIIKLSNGYEGNGHFVSPESRTVTRGLKVAYTSGPIFDKIMKRYPIFSVQIINYQIDQKYK